MRHKYYIKDAYLGFSNDFKPKFVIKKLSTFGNDLEELLDNAVYVFTDSDGDDIANGLANDSDAINFIEEFYDRSNGRFIA